MKKWILVLLTVSFLGMIFLSCSEDDSSTEPENIAPNCTIVLPSDSSEYFIGDTITVQVFAEDVDGSIEEVRFFLDDVEIGVDIEVQYEQDIYTDSLTLGYHSIKIEAEDNEGLETDKQINIKINEIPNSTPVINSLIANPVSVQQNGVSTLTCNATDADGDSLIYSWGKTGGTISGTGSSVTWTAPDTIGDYTITCTVSDGTDIDVETKIITVTETPNNAPTCQITAPADNALFCPGDIITVNVDTEDSDGNILEVRFYFDNVGISSDDSFPYSCEINTSSYSAETHIIKAIAEDNDFFETIDTIVVNLNTPPVINSLTATESAVFQGETSILTCNATDEDGDTLTYTWEKTGGTISGTGSSVTWTAPNTDGSYTITCTVSDGVDTDTATKSVIVYKQGIPGEMVFVQGGTFQMGDHFNEGDSHELPVHSVTVSDFNIGACEVTQGEWATYMPTDTYNYGAGDNYPVYYISWYEIMVYCNERSIAEGITPCYTINSSTNPDDWGSIPTSSNSTWNAAGCNWSANGYRLPTEAEWEYASRGGINNTDNYHYSGSDIIDDVAWYDGNNSPHGSKPVGTKVPNQLGIYDMSGNLWEWCWDWYGSSYYMTCNDLGTVSDPTGPTSGSYRVLRGGYWYVSASLCRVADRYGFDPYRNYNYMGFRVVRRP